MSTPTPHGPQPEPKTGAGTPGSVPTAPVRAPAPTAHAAEPVRACQVTLVRAGDVAAKSLLWLWPDRIPAAKLTLVAGDPGLGKSLLALDIAARVSRGLPWPDAGHRDEGRGAGDEGNDECRMPNAECQDRGARDERPLEPSQIEDPRPRIPGIAPLGKVVLFSAEDDLADTIRPRLVAAGADLQKIILVRSLRRSEAAGGQDDDSFSLATDLPALDCILAQVGGVRLVVIDPLSAYLGRLDTYRNAEVRRLLARLREVAERRRVAILAITHLNKNAAASAVYRTTGSLAFVAAARAVWAVVRDKSNKSRHLLLPVKCNLSGRATGLAYAIVDSPEQPGTPLIAWEREPVTLSADEALRPNRPAELEAQSERAQVAEWIRELLAAGPVSVPDVRRRARETGLSWATVKRAKLMLPITQRPGGFGRPWLWTLVRQCDSGGPSVPQHGEVSHTGQSESHWVPNGGRIEGDRNGEAADAPVACPEAASGGN